MEVCHEINFTNDSIYLKGILHLPILHSNQGLPPLVVGSHGLEGSMESAKQRILARLLPENGVAFLRFDHRGCGRSQGTFIEDTNIEIRTLDFLKAVSHVLELEKTSKVLGIFGSSLGGATCINAWPLLKNMDIDLRCAVLCAAPVKVEKDSPIPVQIIQGDPTLPQEFAVDKLLFNLEDKLAQLNHVLVFHGDADLVVPVENAYKIIESASEPVKLIVQSGGGHQMENPIHQEEFEQETLAWFLKSLL